MCDALQLAISASGKTAQWLKACLDRSAEQSEVYATTAYMMRVMLSHCRMKHDNKTGAETNEQFAQLWQVMTENRDAPPSKKSRRQARLETRPNPFVAFRTDLLDDEGEVDTTPADEKIVVTKWWDGVRAVLLYASGEVTHADLYKAGPNGFVQAHWLDSKTSLELQLPNSRIDDRGNLVEAPPALKKAERGIVTSKPASAMKKKPSSHDLMKRPGASSGSLKRLFHKAPECDRERFELTRRCGHETSMTIMAKKAGTSGQVLQISMHQCAGTDHTPTGMVETIIEEMSNPLHDEVMEGDDWHRLRGCLRFFRDSMKHSVTGEEVDVDDASEVHGDEDEEGEEEDEAGSPTIE